MLPPKKVHCSAFGHVWGASGVRGFFGETRWYQKIFGRYTPEPIVISVVAVGKTRKERVNELCKIAEKLAEIVSARDDLVSPIIRLNPPRSDARHLMTPYALVTETRICISALSQLGLPILVKIDIGTHISDVRRMTDHPACSGVIISDAKRQSVCDWIRNARKAGIEKHINAGGGIFGPFGVWSVWRAGADSISLGTIATVRPWMLRPTVLFANWLFTNHPRRIT
ncbi:MAG: hypothetical protein ACYC48_00595 [Minisyncoccota bacterium]